MKRSILLAAAALSAASAAEARVGPTPQVLEPMRLPAPRTPGPARGFALSGQPDNCAITVAFTSYGTGIDRSTRARMERMLRVDRRVRTFTSRPWGREGEVTLCVRLVRLTDVYRVGRDLNAMIPARPRGPIQVQYPRRMPAPR